MSQYINIYIYLYYLEYTCVYMCMEETRGQCTGVVLSLHHVGSRLSGLEATTFLLSHHPWPLTYVRYPNLAVTNQVLKWILVESKTTWKKKYILWMLEKYFELLFLFYVYEYFVCVHVNVSTLCNVHGG